MEKYFNIFKFIVIASLIAYTLFVTIPGILDVFKKDTRSPEDEKKIEALETQIKTLQQTQESYIQQINELSSQERIVYINSGKKTSEFKKLTPTEKVKTFNSAFNQITIDTLGTGTKF